MPGKSPISPILEGQPALYRTLLPELAALDAPPETKATCASCAMCEKTCTDAVEPVDGVSRLFHPDTKCCTFHPKLPNYLVGAILADEDPAMAEGKRRIEAKIADRVGTTPLALWPPARYSFLYRHVNDFFGKAPTMMCPYLDSGAGLCTIWSHREAICSTFYCKYVEGADGRKIWISLKTYLALVETQLSRYALLQIFPDYLLTERPGLEPTGQTITGEDLEEKPPAEGDYADIWREWAGREIELYRACYGIVRSLAPADVERILGLDGTIAKATLERALQTVQERELPRRLKFNSRATVRWQPDGSVALSAYSEYDGIALAGEAFRLLTEFTGKQTVAETRKLLREKHLADISDDVLMTLYRQRILTTP